LDKVEFINQQTRDTPFSTEHDFFFLKFASWHAESG
jgi:hypothetical protein